MRTRVKDNCLFYDDLTYISTEVRASKPYEQYRYHHLSICKSVEGSDVVISFHNHTSDDPDALDMIYCINQLGFTKEQPIRHFLSQFNTYYFMQAIA